MNDRFYSGYAKSLYQRKPGKRALWVNPIPDAHEAIIPTLRKDRKCSISTRILSSYPLATSTKNDDNIEVLWRWNVCCHDRNRHRKPNRHFINYVYRETYHGGK